MALEFHLNFLGLCVQGVEPAVAAYTQKLGIQPAMIHVEMPNWVMLLDGWRVGMERVEGKNGMMVEVFQAKAPSGLKSENRIAVKVKIGTPKLLPKDEREKWRGPEGIEWELEPDATLKPKTVIIEEVRLNCRNLKAQQDFYEILLRGVGESEKKEKGMRPFYLQPRSLPSFSLHQDPTLSKINLPKGINPLRVSPSWVEFRNKRYPFRSGKI